MVVGQRGDRYIQVVCRFPVFDWRKVRFSGLFAANRMPENSLLESGIAESRHGGSRLEALDYLRGLLAVAVMVYHYAGWAGAEPGAGTLLGRLGIYAVSMFYVLSGLSLGLVYRKGFEVPGAIIRYGIQRLFRIVPLFWVVVTLSLALMLVPSAVRGEPVPAVDPWRVFLNYSLLFGFVQPDAYFSTGAWSIGNEMVFYVFFPVLVLAGTRSTKCLLLAFLMSLMVAGTFTARLGETQPWDAQWRIYINPLNQLPFFVAGMLIATLDKARTAQDAWVGVGLFAAGTVMFLAHDVVGSFQNLVTLVTRPYFFIACVIVVAGVYRANHLLAKIPFKGGLSLLGASTYSIYLLHPFIPVLTTRLLGDGWLGYAVAAVVTIVVSYCTYRWFELPLMRMGKRFANSLQSREEGLRTAA